MIGPEDIQKLVGRSSLRAANFKRVDLQIHSDESGDFPRITDFGSTSFSPASGTSKPILPEKFLEAAADKKLDLIAITDHMKSRKSCEIAAMSQSENQKSVALAGIEVSIRMTQVSATSRDAVHVLCIFKEGTSSEDIERIFSTSNSLRPYDERQDDDTIDVDLKTFVEGVHKNNGICIASHVNSDKGLRRAFFSLADVSYVLTKRDHDELEAQKNSEVWDAEKAALLLKLKEKLRELGNTIQNDYLQFVVAAGIDAVQIQKSTDGKFYRGEHCESLEIRPLAALLTTDAHCLEAIGYEPRITYIKMTVASWDNLRAALKDPDTRIRYADTVGTHNYTKIKGLVFVTNDGFFKGIDDNGRTPQVIAFADNLTCLIGGRGAGKSAVVDTLRYIFKEKAEVESLPEALKSDIYGRLDHTLKETAIYLLLESEDGELVTVKSFYTDWNSRKYESRFLSGEDAGIDLSASAKYRAEIYGWNEIETLGTDATKQLSLLDRFIEDLKQIGDSLNEKRRLLSENRQAILGSARRLAALIPSIKDYEEAKSAYEKINTPEMQSYFAELDDVSTKEQSLTSIRDDVRSIQTESSMGYDLSEKFLEIASRLTDTDLRFSIFGKNDSYVRIASQAYLDLQGSVATVLDELQKQLSVIKSQKNAALEKVAAAAGAEVKGVATVEKRLARKTKYEELAAQKEKIRREREVFNAELTKRTELVRDYELVQEGRSKKRAEMKDSINARLATAIRRGPSIAINFYPHGNREEFQKKLGIYGKGSVRETGVLKGLGLQYLDRRFAEIICEWNRPSQVAAGILQGDTERFAAVHPNGKDSINKEESKRIFDHLNPRIAEFGEEYFAADKLEPLLVIAEIELNDLPQITLDGQPIAGLSPGQRCSALVPIILLQGTHPLIIDQPEDNLDNKLVFDLVVEILRNLKEHRQIIVATHNPNIPVSGDAEQILVFEPLNKFTGKISAQGSIDDATVIEAVKNIMEGGAAAFLTRAQKYRYRLSR